MAWTLPAALTPTTAGARRDSNTSRQRWVWGLRRAARVSVRETGCMVKDLGAVEDRRTGSQETRDRSGQESPDKIPPSASASTREEGSRQAPGPPGTWCPRFFGTAP